VGRNPDHIIAVYIVANRRNGTIYTGVTSNLARRILEHREGLLPGFTARYGCKKLVWYQPHESITAAIQREKRIKKYPRAWKLNLIEAANPHLVDLYNLLNR
jgi:putative endonuclease